MAGTSTETTTADNQATKEPAEAQEATTPEAAAETVNPFRTLIPPTDFSQSPHTPLYTQPGSNGEVETVKIKVGDVEIDAPKEVTLPPKFAPELAPVKKYTPPTRDES